MSAKVIPLQRWLQCFQDATRDLVSVSMRFDDAAAPKGKAPAKAAAKSAPPEGAYIAVLGHDASLHLGICASPDGFRTLARALLGVRRDQELSDQDVADGASEVMNILAVNWQDLENPHAGGAEIHFFEIFGRLAEAGHRVRLVCSGWAGAPPAVTIKGIEVHRSGGRNSFALLGRRAVRRAIAAERPDVVVEDINKLPLFLASTTDLPFCVVVPHLFGRTAFQEAPWPVAATVWLGERPLPRAYRRAGFHAISESTRDDLVARAPEAGGDNVAAADGRGVDAQAVVVADGDEVIGAAGDGHDWVRGADEHRAGGENVRLDGRMDVHSAAGRRDEVERGFLFGGAEEGQFDFSRGGEGELGPDEGGRAGHVRGGHAGSVGGAVAAVGQGAEDADAGGGQIDRS